MILFLVGNYFIKRLNMDNSTTSNNTEFYYDAFISYRRVEPDQTIAKLVHKQLESFKLPMNVARKIKAENPSAKTKITRVFRDQEELPLTNSLDEQIKKALDKSKWLIVICSPNLMGSEWCRTEIEYFTALRGQEYVLTVIADGRSADAIPEMFRKNSQMLAANYRHMPEQNWKKQIKTEFIRLVAPMFGLSFDELKQRHREHILKRRLFLTAAVGLICMLFGIYASYNAYLLKQKNDTILQTNNTILQQNDTIIQKNNTILRDEAVLLALKSDKYLKNMDVNNAILTSYQALTEYDGNQMPYTDEAKSSLINALKPYQTIPYNNMYTDATVETDGIITDVQISPNSQTVMLFDDTNSLYFFDMNSYKLLNKISVPSSIKYINSTRCTNLLLNDFLFYIDENSVKKYDFVNNNFVDEPIYMSSDPITSLKLDSVRNGVFIHSKKNMQVYDIESDKIIVDKYVNDFISVDFDENTQYFMDSIMPLDDGTVVMNLYADGIGYLSAIVTDSNFSYDESIIVSDKGLPNPCIILDVERVDDKAFILCLKYYDNEQYVTELSCYSYTTHDFIWTKEYNNQIDDYSNFSVNKHRLEYLSPYGYGEPILVLCTDHMISQVDMATGDTLYPVFFDRLSNIYLFPPLSAVVVNTTSGEQVFYCEGQFEIPIPNKDFYTSSKDISKLVYVTDNARTITGSIIVPEKDNRGIIMKSQNQTILDSDTESEVDDNNKQNKEYEYISKDSPEKIETISTQLNIPNKELIDSIVFDDTKENICVSYRTMNATLFSVHNNTVEPLCSFELLSPIYGEENYVINKYCGIDSSGNAYWASDEQGYCISKDCHYMFNIAFLLDVDSDDNFIIGDSYNSYRMPILSTDELLSAAKDYLDAHNMLN